MASSARTSTAHDILLHENPSLVYCDRRSSPRRIRLSSPVLIAAARHGRGRRGVQLACVRYTPHSITALYYTQDNGLSRPVCGGPGGWREPMSGARGVAAAVRRRVRRRARAAARPAGWSGGRQRGRRRPGPRTRRAPVPPRSRSSSRSAPSLSLVSGASGQSLGMKVGDLASYGASSPAYVGLGVTRPDPRGVRGDRRRRRAHRRRRQQARPPHGRRGTGGVGVHGVGRPRAAGAGLRPPRSGAAGISSWTATRRGSSSST